MTNLDTNPQMRTLHRFYNNNLVSNVWEEEIMHIDYVSIACIYAPRG